MVHFDFGDAAVTRIWVLFCRQVNDVDLTYVNCDGSAHSYLAQFPNFAERPSYSGASDSIEYTACGYGQSLLSSNPSGRVMPSRYFTFIEGRFGRSCGVFVQTDGMVPAGTTAIGFR